MSKVFLFPSRQGLYTALRMDAPLHETLVPMPISNRPILKNSWKGRVVSYFWNFLKLTLRKDFCQFRLANGIVKSAKSLDKAITVYENSKVAFFDQLANFTIKTKGSEKLWQRHRSKMVAYHKKFHPLRNVIETELTRSAFEFRAICKNAGTIRDLRIEKNTLVPAELKLLNLENAAGMAMPMVAFRKMLQDLPVSASEKRACLDFMQRVKKSLKSKSLETIHDVFCEFAKLCRFEQHPLRVELPKVFVLELNLYEIGCKWLMEKDLAFVHRLRNPVSTRVISIRTLGNKENPDEKVDLKVGRLVRECRDGSYQFEAVTDDDCAFDLSDFQFAFGQNPIAQGIREAMRTCRSRILLPLDLFRISEKGEWALVRKLDTNLPINDVRYQEAPIDFSVPYYLNAMANLIAFLKAKNEFPPSLTFDSLGIDQGPFTDGVMKQLKSHELLIKGAYDSKKMFQFIEDASLGKARNYAYLIERSGFNKSSEAALFRKIIKNVCAEREFQVSTLVAKNSLKKDRAVLEKALEFELQLNLFREQLQSKLEKRGLKTSSEKVNKSLLKALTKYCQGGWIAPDLESVVLQEL